MPLWKRLLLRSIGIGAGFSLMLSLIVGAWVWYSSRPKPEQPWNNRAIKAVWTELTLSAGAEKCYLNFRYSLENTTDKDYSIPSTAKIMVRLPQDMSYTENSDLTWEHGEFVPARQKLNVQIRVPFNYADYGFSKAKADDLKQLTKFTDRRLSEIDGFVLFDPVNRFRVDFPNGWPEAAKHVAEEQGKK